MGCEATLSTRYMADLIGLDTAGLLSRILMDNPRNPIHADSIDLIHPPDAKSIKPEWIAAYGDAFRVKSARAVSALLTKAGSGAASLAIIAIRASPPPDGPALLQLIKTATRVDLSDEVKSK